jgi:hypothetical protein
MLPKKAAATQAGSGGMISAEPVEGWSQVFRQMFGRQVGDLPYRVK